MQRGINPLFHPVAVCQTGQGIEFGQTVGFFFASEIQCDVDCAAAKSDKVRVIVVQGPAREPEDDVVLCITGLYGQICKTLAGIEPQPQRSTVAIAVDGYQQLLKRFAGSACKIYTQTFENCRAKVNDPTVGVGRPEAQCTAALDFFDHIQLFGTGEGSQ